MRKTRFLVLAIVYCWALSSVGQELKDLEMVNSSATSLTFDYRLHRNPAFIYRTLLSTDSLKNKTLTHLYHGSIIYNYGTPSNPKPTSNPKSKGLYKVDIQLEPYYNSRFGDKDDPFRTQIGIGPKIQLNSKKGLYAVFQWLIPLQNDFTKELGYGNRPGETGFGYTKIISKQHFFNAFAGTLTNRRYGINGDYIFMNRQGTIYSGLSLFFTGGFIYTDGTFTRERLDYISGYAFFAYRFKKSDITLKTTFERYLDNELGVTFEAYRQFGNTDIGFYAQKGERGENAGLKITFSLWPRKFYSNSWIQIRLPHSLNLQYDLKAATQSGEQVRAQTDFYYEILRFNPSFINKHIKNSGLTNQ